ncbi:MAG: hypothetical protein NTX45_25695 [Proteobacteria bacterium]|nr:hypothetical protein [Pseudomonadota bacterium]
MFYDLLEVPDGYETELVLVIAPYFDPKFIKELVKKLAPNQIRLIIDDGVRQEDVDNINKACGKKADVKIGLASAKGLVHIKMFYLEFAKSEGRRQRKRRFLFGSANATEAAFGENRNSELLAEVDLSAGQDSDVLDYINSTLATLEGKQDKVEGIYGPLRNSPILHLPDFRVSAPGHPASGFDVWLQRGVLAAKYHDAQQFLMASITLNKRLPQDLIAKMFTNHGLIEQGERNIVRFAYMGDIAAEPLEDATPQWKARYCVWTHLGDWVSDDCYRKLGYTMKSKAAPLREAKINELLANMEEQAWKDYRKSIFLESLNGVWNDLLSEKVPPNDYLRGSESFINHSFYSKQFDNKLEKDILLAQTEDFYSRYIKGYDFPDVPRFRQDTAAWQNFALSWCSSILVESRKVGSRSLLAKKIRETISKVDGEDAFDEISPEDILKWLKKSWAIDVTKDNEEMTVGDIVAAYYI